MIITKIKKWGNSFGVLIPKNELNKMNIKEDQEVIVEIARKDNPLKELFGFGKRNKIRKSTEQILRETRAELGVD